MSRADQLLVYQTLLDEAGGNYRIAFEIACARLAAAYVGVSHGFMRWGGDGDGIIVADPPPVDDGSWIETGRERNA